MFIGNERRKERSRSEKRKDRYKHARQKTLGGELTLDISRQELCKLQGDSGLEEEKTHTYLWTKMDYGTI